MKLMTKTLLAVGIGISMLSVCVSAMSGTGTKADPYTVTDAADFARFASDVSATGCSGKYYRQTADIDLSDSSIAPIGTEAKPFMGTYDGAGYALSGFSASVKDGCSGLFGYVKDASVSNLTLNGETVTAAVHAGGIAAVAQGNTVIDHCDAAVAFVLPSGSTPLYADAGGLVGKLEANAKVVSSKAEVAVSLLGSSTYKPFILFFGGIAGENLGTVDKCTVSGSQDLYSLNYLVVNGGIVGENVGTVSGCTSTTAVSSTISIDSAYAYVGGIAGANNGGVVTRCVNGGTVSGTGKSPYPCYVGGIVGYNTNGNINLSKNAAKTSGKNSFGGGIAGVNLGYEGTASVSDCLNTVTPSVSGVAGGLIGDNVTSNHEASSVSLTSSLYNGNTGFGIVGITEKGENAVHTVTAAYATSGSDSLGVALKKAASYVGFENGAWIFVPDVSVLPDLFVVSDLEQPAMAILGDDGTKAAYGLYIPEDGENAPTKFVVAYYKDGRLTGMQIANSDTAKGYLDGSITLPAADGESVKILPFASLSDVKPAGLEAITLSK